MSRITLEQWIDEALKDQDKDGVCTAFACIYKSSDGKTREVHALKLKGRTWDPKSLSDLFRGKAEHFAQDLGGMQRFEMWAFYGDRSEPQAVHPFSVYDGIMNFSGKVVREGPDREGITAQLMRHVERNEEILAKIVETFAVQAVRREEFLAGEMTRLQTEVRDAYTIVLDMMAKQQTMDHERRMKELEFQRNSEERRKLLSLGPAILNTISGKEIFPQATADSELWDAIGEEVDPQIIDQLLQMGIIKNPKTAALLVNRLKQVTDQRAKEKEAAKALPEAKNTNGGIS